MSTCVTAKINTLLKTVVADFLLSLDFLSADYQHEILEKSLSLSRISRPPLPEYGDWSTNLPLVLLNLLKKEKKDLNINLFYLSDVLTKGLTESPKNGFFDYFDRIEPKKGFLNFYLNSQYYFKKLNDDFVSPGTNWKFNQHLLSDRANDFSPAYLIEYSSPNIAKPFTIGHLRSTIIGQALANLLSLTGAKVYRDNHLGDWGTQFGKLIWAIQKWGNIEEIRLSSRPVKNLVDLYVRFHDEAELNPQILDEARAWFKKLEAGDIEARRIWQFCIDVSTKEFDKIYKKLDVYFTENQGGGYPESFFEDKMQAVLDELRAKKLTRISDGAELVFFPDDKYPPLMVLRQDGATLYATRDLATDKFRLQAYGPDLVIINEVGSEQRLYFQQLFETEKLLGWVKPQHRYHLAHGLYRFKNGKMSTRKGEVIWLEDVLQEIYQVIDKNSSSHLTSEEKWSLSIAALKWNDISREASKDIVFSLEEITDVKGNSGPYMLYTFVRCLSILKKQTNYQTDCSNNYYNNYQSTYDLLSYFYQQLSSHRIVSSSSDLLDLEIQLLRKLDDFNQALFSSAKNYAPHLLAIYLFELAGQFNHYYAHTKISNSYHRLRLVWLIAQTLFFGLKTLGIPLVERM